MSYVVECVGATALPAVGADLAASCASAGGTLVFTESSGVLPDLTLAEGGLIATAIVGLWVVGFTFRAIRKMIEGS